MKFRYEGSHTSLVNKKLTNVELERGLLIDLKFLAFQQRNYYFISPGKKYYF